MSIWGKYADTNTLRGELRNDRPNSRDKIGHLLERIELQGRRHTPTPTLCLPLRLVQELGQRFTYLVGRREPDVKAAIDLRW